VYNTHGGALGGLVYEQMSVSNFEKNSHLLRLVSIKAFTGQTRMFSVLKLTGYSYNMMTS